jgi:hypothetical protein
MSTFYLGYQLRNGYIHDWLVAGPQAIPVSELDRFPGENFQLRIARQYFEEEPGIPLPPRERDSFTIGDAMLTWRHVHCLDDHFVNVTAFYPIPHYLRTWAYAQIRVPAAQEVHFILTTNGPADVWINGRHVHRQEHFHHQLPHSVPFRAVLQEGRNEFLVRFEAVAARECPYVMALQIAELAAVEVPVFLPTFMEAIARRQTLERAFERAYLDRDIYGRSDDVIVRWPEYMPETASVAVRFQDTKGRIYSEGWLIAKSSASVNLIRGIQVSDGPYRAVIMPQPREYYEGNMRIRRELPLWVVKNEYSEEPDSTYAESRLEALEDAARREEDLFAEIAKMELGRWDKIKVHAVKDAIVKINQRQDGSDLLLIGLLGAIYRYWENPSFPEELRQPLEECILDFKYWMDEPGHDVMDYWSEHHQILFHTCEILAGQFYPDRVFTNAGETGQWHREKGERMALAWLRKRAMGGFQEWNSNCCFEEDALALVHLAELAQSPRVREMATAVLDKLFFTMALNSYRGTFGSTHGRTDSLMIKGGRLEATAGLSRLLWGMGVFNHHIRGMVSLACAKNYRLPLAIRSVALDLPAELWSRERHAGELEDGCDRATGRWEVNTVTYKTPDYMLCSAQNYRPGERGYQEHIWQATMGPEAVVFVNHPACMSEDGSHRPNFWCGNVILPRVAQWKDVLIAIYRLPTNDWMGFTHAYFPLYAFEEYAIREGWAFARKRDGYLALKASQEMTLVTRGPSAYRELRAYGQNHVWICHMGRAAQDGSFGEFQSKILALGVRLEGLTARCPTLRGEILDFGWEGSLRVNGVEQPITGFRHYENPYCIVDWPAARMEIQGHGHSVTLDFNL